MEGERCKPTSNGPGKYLMRRFVTMCALILGGAALSGCNGSATQIAVDTPTPLPLESPIVAPTATAPVAIISFRQLSQVRSIRIEDDWTGLSPVAPIVAHYDLHRQNGSFSGKANFSVAGYTQARTAVEEVSIPEDTVLAFLQLLSRSPTEYGHYEPLFEHTDDYPSISIQLGVENDIVEFYTRSQGGDHVPWAGKVQGNIYVINSNLPAQALALLEPYLKKDRLKQLIENNEVGMPDTGGHDPQP
jgi:hypothetical protein